MRLIDADALWLVTEGDHQYYEKFEIENAPTVDAVEVVRCKDCKYYDGEYLYCCHDVWAIPNGYCHHGKRREDETD